MANSYQPWAAYRALMACPLVALDKRPGVRPVGIGETLRRDLDKLVMRADGDQAKTVCGNLQLCAGLEAGIEGATHAVGQRRLERVRVRRSEEDEADYLAEEEEEIGWVEEQLNNIRIETVGTEEEAAEGLAASLVIEAEEDRGGKGEEGGGGGGTQRALGALEFLTQDAEPSVTTLVDARNSFNKLSRLAML